MSTAPGSADDITPASALHTEPEPAELPEGDDVHDAGSSFNPLPDVKRGMDFFLVEGGRPLAGVIPISGAKNAVLPLMSAALMAPGRHVFHNVPRLRDVSTMARVLEVLGAACTFEGHTLIVDTTHADKWEAPYELVKTMRASIYVLGPLLARLGHARVSLPGGCAWGPRPVDLHIGAMEQFGAELEIDHGYIVAHSDRLRGARIVHQQVSVGATAQIMMAAALADGVTVLENAAAEPDVVALADYINAMGGHITGHGTKHIEIEGVRELRAAEATVIPDRIEAGTFLVAGAITGSTLRLTGVAAEHIAATIHVCEAMGAHVLLDGSDVIVSGPDRPHAANVTTAPFPGFPTDMQAQIMALASVARGTSVLSETIYHDRFTHVAELRRLGADIKLEGAVAIINGVRHLSGAPVMATDLRASACLILAALCADGETKITRIYHVDRGYETIETKLNAVGARIVRDRE